jgi:hypothetical protein
MIFKKHSNNQSKLADNLDDHNKYQVVRAVYPRCKTSTEHIELAKFLGFEDRSDLYYFINEQVKLSQKKQ